MKMDYSSLIGFIYSQPKLRNKAGFAKYLGISIQALREKLEGRQEFKQSQIIKFKTDFELTPDQVDRYFFTPKLRKLNCEEKNNG